MARASRSAVDIIAAAKFADLEGLRKAVAQGADIERRDCDGMTALMCAAEAASVECLTFLIQASGRIDSANHEGSTPLILAAQSLSEACLGVLVEAGADLDATDKKGRDVVFWANRHRLHDAARMVEAIRESRRELREFVATVPASHAKGRSSRC